MIFFSPQESFQPFLNEFLVRICVLYQVYEEQAHDSSIKRKMLCVKYEVIILNGKDHYVLICLFVYNQCAYNALSLNVLNENCLLQIIDRKFKVLNSCCNSLPGRCALWEITSSQIHRHCLRYLSLHYSDHPMTVQSPHSEVFPR